MISTDVKDDGKQAVVFHDEIHLDVKHDDSKQALVEIHADHVKHDDSKQTHVEIHTDVKDDGKHAVVSHVEIHSDVKHTQHDGDEEDE
ncbi:hypothetical protein FXO37_28465 [Capsicum annuum]|nr:hypothetical protein FXO37_28465 [Capsicum annuum]